MLESQNSNVQAAAPHQPWLRLLDREEKRTLTASFGGYGLDAFDYYTLPLVTPILLSVWGVSRTEIGLIGTATLVSSAIGGWLAGILADRHGRVRILQLTIAVFAVCTFLCGLAQTPEQLLVTRSLQGLGFGGEWAVGSVLIAEAIRPQWRGRAVGLVQSSWAIGWGCAVLASVLVFSWLPGETAWRVLFLLGLAPALLIFFIRRSVNEPALYLQQRQQVAAGKFFDIFKPRHLRTTVLASLMFTGMQGGYYAINTWLPTFLSTERKLTVLGTGGYQALFIVGAFIGYLSGAHCSDQFGRRLTFVVFASGAATLAMTYMLLPINDGAMLLLGLPLGFVISGIFSGSGAFLAESFPTAIRGSGQGFCYNFGRGIGALFPAAVGFLSDQHTTLAAAIGVCAGSAYALVVLAAVLLPERRAVDLNDV